jgi:hypothetical protein
MTTREQVSLALHKLYDRYAIEPVPSDMTELLAKLK